jgi:serine O-acetyltransferase
MLRQERQPAASSPIEACGKIAVIRNDARRQTTFRRGARHAQTLLPARARTANLQGHWKEAMGRERNRERPPSRGAQLVRPDWNLKEVVAALRTSREVTHSVRHLGKVRELPSVETIADIVEDLRATLFPTHFGSADLTDDSIDFFVGDTLNVALTQLAEQIRRGLLFDPQAGDYKDADPAVRAGELTRAFAAQLPAIRALIVSDLHAAYEGDPAATSVSEILLCYPGIRAIMLYRFAHALFGLGAQLIARLISEIAHARTGCEIHPGARIGASFFIDHGTGVVIGGTSIVGERVRLYQGVTLGAKSFPADADGKLIKGVPRHPIVEDDVVIYAGATILGRITVGRGSVIGGNVWLTHSIEANSNLSQAQMRTT